jgi:tetratricopeptide (TPR) repeat protein
MPGVNERATTASDEMEPHARMGVVCRLGAAWALQQLGYPEQAERWGDEAVGLARGVTSPYNLCNALLFLALWRVFRREWRMAQQCIDEALHLTIGPGFRLYAAIGQIVRGATLTAQDRAEEGLTHIRQGLAICHDMGAKVLQPWGLAMVAEGDARLGQPAEDLTALSEAQALIAITREGFYAAEIFRVQGKLLNQGGRQAPDAGSGVSPAATVETCFSHALEVARRQQAKFWELRAAMSLSRLWSGQGRREEARQLLGKVYNWFTEGSTRPTCGRPGRCWQSWAARHAAGRPGVPCTASPAVEFHTFHGADFFRRHALMLPRV